MAIRVYLAGPVALEAGDRVITSAEFGARQSRLLFARLTLAGGQAVPKGELADVLWADAAPASWEISLAALASKLRALVAPLLGRRVVDGALGAYRLALPPDAWVDILAAGAELYRAEGAILRGSAQEAASHALIAATIARRPFLPDDHGTWVEAMRVELAQQRVRALEILAETLLRAGDHARAIRAASDIIDSDPFRETAYQLLMRAHAAAGNRADALRAYDRCRRLLSDELGVAPSSATEAVYLEVLRG